MGLLLAWLCVGPSCAYIWAGQFKIRASGDANPRESRGPFEIQAQFTLRGGAWGQVKGSASGFIQSRLLMARWRARRQQQQQRAARGTGSNAPVPSRKADDVS